MGTPVAELIELAGGMKQNKSLKAFLPGGASSNFLTANHVHTPLDFDAMKKVGSMLGTGAVIVIADDMGWNDVSWHQRENKEYYDKDFPFLID